MRRFTRRGVSSVIATILMAAITIILTATLGVMVMSFNTSSVPHYGSFTKVEKAANDQFVLTFGSFQPRTLFSEVKASMAGQITPQALSSYPSSTPYGPNSKIASMYFIDQGMDGSINTGDSLVIKFDASMVGMVVDVTIILIVDGNAIASISLIVGEIPPTPIPEDYIYTINSNVATITGYKGAGGAIAIPSTLGGRPVAVIKQQVFRSSTSLTSVTIPNSVKTIENNAFYSCTALTSVIIGSGVTSIGGQMFQSCTSLTSVTIPNSVTSIDDNAFNSCTSLTSATIGSGVTSIGNSAFRSCTSLTSVTIPNSVKTIGNSAFQSCTSLTSVTMGSGVTSIGNYAFQSCSSLTSVTIPNSVKTIGNSAFAYCYKLSSVIIGNGVTSIGDGAFRSCILTSVTIPNSVVAIRTNTFYSCTALTSVIIGSGVTSIGSAAFAYCNKLTSITFYGLTAPVVDNVNWITGTAPGIRGHILFGASGYTNPFYGLTMLA